MSEQSAEGVAAETMQASLAGWYWWWWWWWWWCVEYYTTMYNLWMVTTGERIVSEQSAEGVAAETMQASLAGWWWWWWWWCAE